MGSKQQVLVRYPLGKQFKVTCPYGKVTNGYRDNKPHNGVDFGCPVNSEAVACFDGIVSWYKPVDNPSTPTAIKNNRLGNYLILRSDSHRAKYAHLNKFIALPGQQVKAGQLIALTGNTGVTSGPHLHFDVRDNKTNEYIEPIFEEPANV